MNLRFSIARLVAWLEDLKKKRDEKAAAIDLSRKCPGCGHKAPHTIECVDGEIEGVSGRTKIIRHKCVICRAESFEQCIVKPETWQRK